MAFIVVESFAQQNNVMPLIQSPNASGLGTFGSIDISAFTGLPNISVNVFSLKQGDIPINCELRYMGGGVRPSAHPGWVGQNWALSVGGVVTRKVNGGVDEVQNTGVLPTDPNYNKYSFLYGGYNILNNNNWNTSGFATSNWPNNYSPNILPTNINPAPDEFSFTLPTGVSGSFFLDHLGNWEVKSKSSANLKINVQTGYPTISKISSYNGLPYSINLCRTIYTITITDELGYVYTFGNSSNAIEFSRGAKSAAYVDGNNVTIYPDVIANAWYLTQVTSPTGNVVNFSYVRNENQYVQVVSYPGMASVSFPVTSMAGAIGTYANQQTSATYSGQVISPVYLSQISCNNFTVNFNVSQTTELQYNYHNGVFTNSNFGYQDLEINDMVSPSSSDINQLSKWYELNSIIINDNTGNTREKYTFGYNNNINQRLFLNEFRKINLDNTGTDMVYGFTYNLTALPAYNSLQQDQWGYFNNITFPAVVTGITDPNLTNPNPPGYFAMDGNNAQAGILQTIKYPTGGSSTFNWEPNNFSNVLQKNGYAINLTSSTGIGGGLRINSIVNSDNKGNNYTKSYVYKWKGTSNSSGILSGYKKIIYSASIGNPTQAFVTGIDYNDYSRCLNYTDGRDVVYSEVQEILADGSYNLYDYSNSDNPIYIDEVPLPSLPLTTPYSDGYFANTVYYNNTGTFTSSLSFPFLSHSSRELERGQLLSLSSYNSSGVPLKQITNTYNSDPNRFNNYVRSYDNYSIQASMNGVLVNERYFQPIKIYTYYPYLQNSTTTVWDKNGQNPVSTVTNYTYDAYRNKKTESYTSSMSELVSNSYNYANDAITGLGTTASAAQTAMVNANMTGIILEKLSSKNNIATSHSRTDFQVLTNGSITQILPAAIYQSFSTGALELKQQYNRFDAFGNLLEEQKANDIKQSYLWGYGSMYPVAKIIDVDYNTASATVIPSILNAPSSDGALRTELNKLRGLSNAQVTSYTYAPLIGMTSQTDPSGHTSYYNYDGLGRLQVIRDQDQNIIKRFYYNYSGQTENFNVTGFTNQSSYSGTFTSTSSCGAGTTPATYTITIPAGTYYSPIDQATADQLALTAYNNGQVIANSLPCLAAISYLNTSSMPYTVAFTNIVTGAVYTFSAYPNSSSSTLGNVPIGNYNITMTPYSTTSSNLTFNGTPYTASSTFILNTINISTASSFTIQSAAASGPCSFTMSSGYSSPTNGISNNGTTASGYLVFYSNSTMTQGNSYFIATVNGGCRPSATRSFTVSSGGRNWTITIYSNGQMYAQMAYGSATLNPYSTVSLGSLSYNL